MNYDDLALMWAEKYGIVSYRVKSNIMTYNVSYPSYLGNERYTVQHCVNLDTGAESVRRLQRYDSKGVCNRH